MLCCFFRPKYSVSSVTAILYSFMVPLQSSQIIALLLVSTPAAVSSMSLCIVLSSFYFMMQVDAGFLYL